eukprot:c987_g1_i1.p1 GENE.c987_g1_i1~~c987_g1_i1.p1  ORF type:complete len:246 (+),score=31.80 c987_g1_i1:34-738(+)
MSDSAPTLTNTFPKLREYLTRIAELDAKIQDISLFLEQRCRQHVSRQQGLFERSVNAAPSLPADCRIHAKHPISSLPIGQSLVRKLAQNGIRTVEELSMLRPGTIESLEVNLNMQGSQKRQFSDSVKQARQIVLNDLELIRAGPDEPDAKRAKVDSRDLPDAFTWADIKIAHQECVKLSQHKIELVNEANQLVDQVITDLQHAEEETAKQLQGTTDEIVILNNDDADANETKLD